MVPRPAALALTLALTLTLALGATARAADVAAGLSRADLRSILELAGARWPAAPCRSVTFFTLSPGAMRGMRVAPAAERSCTVLFRRGARLTPSGWCRALEPVFARLAAPTAPSSWPYDCTLAVGPLPRAPRLVSVPGLSPSDVRAAYDVATAHWPDSGCRGREQLRWATPAQLAAGSGGEPEEGVVTMGIARRRDPRCTVFLNASVTGWTAGELCVVIEHEFGHLKGLPHAPSGVMAPVNAHSPDCEAAFGPAPLAATAPSS